MKFEQITYHKGEKITSPVEFDGLEDVKKTLHSLFEMDPEVVSYVEVKFENGKESVSLMGSGNKIIIQIKTI